MRNAFTALASEAFVSASARSFSPLSGRSETRPGTWIAIPARLGGDMLGELRLRRVDMSRRGNHGAARVDQSLEIPAQRIVCLLLLAAALNEAVSGNDVLAAELPAELFAIQRDRGRCATRRSQIVKEHVAGNSLRNTPLVFSRLALSFRCAFDGCESNHPVLSADAAL
jgi:hypothetical protein